MTVEATQDKQITIDVPADRVAEFYAFYGRFLAGFPGRRRGHRGHRGHGCGRHHHEHEGTEQASAQASGPETATV